MSAGLQSKLVAIPSNVPVRLDGSRRVVVQLSGFGLAICRGRPFFIRGEAQIGFKLPPGRDGVELRLIDRDGHRREHFSVSPSHRLALPKAAALPPLPIPRPQLPEPGPVKIKAIPVRPALRPIAFSIQLQLPQRVVGSGTSQHPAPRRPPTT